MDRCQPPPENLSGAPIDLFVRYDVIIRAKQSDGEWCDYSPIYTPANLDAEDIEQTMFDVLFNFAEIHNLSYTEQIALTSHAL